MDLLKSAGISADALLLTKLVDAWEDRDVGTADVDDVCLHVDMDDYAIIKLKGKSVDIMCEVN